MEKCKDTRIDALRLSNISHINLDMYPASENLPDNLFNVFPDIEKTPVLIPCNHCSILVESVLHPQADVKTIKDIPVKFVSYTAICPTCGAELMWGEIDALNQCNLYDSYRRQKGIISLERIREIPEKYSIGKRPLSLILGWGELTFTRFYDGDIPSKKYSDQLLEIYDNPQKYRDVLCENSHRITQLSVQKSLRRVNETLEEYATDKCLLACATYICTVLDDITAKALQKLLYYTEGFFYLFYLEDCFQECCVAWQHGPVYTSIYYLNKEGKIQGSSESLHSEWISLQLRGILDAVIQYFGCYSGDILRDFTHAEIPWRNAWDAGKGKGRTIDHDDMHSYFQEIRQRFDIKIIADIKRYALSMFERR